MATYASAAAQPVSAGAPAPSFLDLSQQFDALQPEITQAVTRVLGSQQFILGPEVDAFEREIAAYIRVPYAIGCASGSDALLLSLMCLGIAAGDEVLTTAFTFIATAGAIVRCGAKPVFVDIDPDTFNIDATQLAGHVTPHTRCVIPVHLFGLPADINRIKQDCTLKGIHLVEDAAQALGASYRGTPVGGLGDLACFSFFPSKNLGCAGDGGLVTTCNSDYAARLRLLRVHGSDRKYHYPVVGINSRLDALQAAILRIKLRHLRDWSSRRQERATVYRCLFNEFGLSNTIRLPQCPPDRDHVYNQFSIRCLHRNALRTYLKDKGIPTEIYYPEPLHLQPAFENLGYRPGSLPETERACAEVLALPIYPELREDQQNTTVRAIADFYRCGAWRS